MFRTVLMRETRWCHYYFDIPLSSEVIVKLFQWDIDISSLMTSVAKQIKAIDKKNFYKNVACAWEALSIVFFSNSVYHSFGENDFCRRMFHVFLIFHICLPTVTSILT